MKRFATVGLAMSVVFGLALLSRARADDKPDGPPPKQNDAAPGGGGQGGPGGPGGPGGGPQGRPPGGVHVIPRFAEEKLNLTDDQKKQVADLEKEVKEKLAKILTPEQMTILEQARPPRPGGQGGPAGQGGGRGGPGGNASGGSGNGNGNGQAQRPQPPSSN